MVILVAPVLPSSWVTLTVTLIEYELLEKSSGKSGDPSLNCNMKNKNNPNNDSLLSVWLMWGDEDLY